MTGVKHLGAVAAQDEAALTHLFEIIQQSMRLAGWDPKWRVALVMEHDDRSNSTAYVSNIASAARVREIMGKYANQEAERNRIASDALNKARGNKRG